MKLVDLKIQNIDSENCLYQITAKSFDIRMATNVARLVKNRFTNETLGFEFFGREGIFKIDSNGNVSFQDVPNDKSPAGTLMSLGYLVEE